MRVRLGLLTATASRMLILQALATLTAENVSPLQVISFRFSPLIPPDESHHSSDPLCPPTQPDPSVKEKKTPHNYQQCWGFAF